jgi:excinuclease ABC subunit C
VLVDGGRGQLNAVKGVLEDLGIEDVCMVGVAKGPHHGRDGREVFHLMDGRELTLPVNSPVLFYLQRLRDEAHRFAIGAHRDKRSKAIGASPLDEVPGIGPARKKALLMHFGTARAVRGASLEDLQKAPGCRPRWRSSSTTISIRADFAGPAHCIETARKACLIGY